ncbi:trans-aconitate 2-methyltransferase [Pseudoruegeria sp. HB172150]|uniref:class I SAM-dependent methyltransferase n=1 Tax=Pseudoruegeria sp. HB172150 TaxID=2721164 RepID=UPI00155259FB|nr:class I SAM-dependent methyltransferase [Pseudoruegeria sp. HB172150]
MGPEDILHTYERVARGYAASRSRSLFERRWLDRMLNHAPGRRVLDLGCGPGKPIAEYLSDRRCAVTGVDGAPAMVALFRQNLPQARAVHADMRHLDLGEEFDAILAWDSFFHLSPDDQRAMFPVFAAHAAPRAVLMFTSGPAAGEPIGKVEGEPVYHASLNPDDYRALLAASGFEVIAFQPRDPDCAGHTIWLARRASTA